MILSDPDTNPYQSPAQEASDPQVPLTQEQVRRLLRMPALGLGTLAFLWLDFIVFVEFVLLSDAPYRLINSDQETVATFVAIVLAGAILAMPPILMLAAAVQMFRLRGYRWCWVGFLTGVLPLTTKGRIQSSHCDHESIHPRYRRLAEID